MASQNSDQARQDPAPLHGVRVIDFTRLLPGPACTQILAEFGAEVIRVEDASRDDGGDFLRVPTNADESRRSSIFARGALYEAVNRGKRSIALDLKSKAGQDIAQALAARSQVLVEGFRPGVMHRLNLGYEQLALSAPALVYCSISGYGQEGPWAGWAGHDINYLSLTGVLDQFRGRSGPPVLPSVQWADLASGALNATIGILAALLQARSTERGRHLDIAMAQGLYGLQASISALLEASGQVPTPGSAMLTGGVASYQVYATRDGRYLAVGALEPHFWARFCDVIGRSDLLNQGLCDGDEGRHAIETVSSIIGEHPLEHWVRVFEGRDCCVTPVLSLSEATSHGPYPRHSTHLFPIQWGTVELGPAPQCGADGLDLLAELGYGRERARALAEAGIIRWPPAADHKAP
jgi:crotonobetainyl-CoA:carnitine CoA-transferase CaiB-like acyl-CoA transferase